jgi:hypothetical protein
MSPAVSKNQADSLTELTAAGWKTVPPVQAGPGPPTVGGPIPVIDPHGRRWLILPDGTLQPAGSTG